MKDTRQESGSDSRRTAMTGNALCWEASRVAVVDMRI